MTLKQIAILALGIIAVSVVLKPGNADSIRLCGKRLSDLLTFICEKHGGFHAPRVRKNVTPRSDRQRPADLLQSVVRRNDPNAVPTSLSGVLMSHEGGVVDECCKKQCTLATLVSYCANARNIENIDINEILSSGMENMPIISETELSQSSSTNLGSASPRGPHPGRFGNSRPNLGLSNRNRSVFIVLSQLQQEDEDKALGEYRF